MTTNGVGTETSEKQEDQNQEPSGEEKQAPNTDASGDGELDYKALLEKSQADNLKLTNDNKSLLGRIKEPALDPRMDDMLDEVGALRRAVNAVGVRTASGETEEIPADFLKIDQSTATQQATRQYEQGYAKAEADLFDAFREEDEEGNPVPGGKIVVDVDNDPAVAEITRKWTSAKTTGDLTALRDLVTDAHKLRRRLDRLAASKTADATEKAQKAKDAENGVNNLSITGPAAGSGKKMSSSQVQKATDVSQLSDEAYADYVAKG